MNYISLHLALELLAISRKIMYTSTIIEISFFFNCVSITTQLVYDQWY